MKSREFIFCVASSQFPYPEPIRRDLPDMLKRRFPFSLFSFLGTGLWSKLLLIKRR